MRAARGTAVQLERQFTTRLIQLQPLQGRKMYSELKECGLCLTGRLVKGRRILITGAAAPRGFTRRTRRNPRRLFRIATCKVPSRPIAQHLSAAFALERWRRILVRGKLVRENDSR
jgi:hypothetical protein